MPAPPADDRRRRPVVLHLTTADISLELLIGPQLSAFIESGYDVHATSSPGPFVAAVEARGVTFHPLEHSTRSMSLLADLRAAFDFFRLCRKLQPDIVHTHNPKPGVYGRLAARLARVPVVINTVHGLYAQPSDPFPRRLVVYGLERLAAAASNAELVQNEEDIPVLRTLRIPADRIHLLGNGVDLGRFHPASLAEKSELRRQLGVPDDAVVVGAVGRLVAEKGYLELLRAWSTVRDRFPTAQLVIIGPQDPSKTDALDNELIEAAKAGDGAGVTFLGHRDDVEQLYRLMDVYVLASHREGFPRSAMEAAASGLPLVLTDIRGCRQVVAHGVNGVLVPPRDDHALAEALIDLIDDPDTRHRMAAASLRRAAERFDQQHVIDITVATYDRLMKRRAARRR